MFFYKGDFWERRENDKFISWIRKTESVNLLLYQYSVSNKTWYYYESFDCISPEVVDTPYIELAYIKRNNNNKVYIFTLNEYNINLEGMFIATEEEIKEVIGRTIEIGPIVIEVQEHMFSELKVNKSTINDLLQISPKSTICGYNPLDYIKD